MTYYIYSGNMGASYSWNPQGMSRPVKGLFYLYHIYTDWVEKVRIRKKERKKESKKRRRVTLTHTETSIK
jgi:hypothetical protein